MIAKVIVGHVASKSVDYKFDYIIPEEQLESVIQPGVRNCTFLDQYDLRLCNGSNSRT